MTSIKEMKDRGYVFAQPGEVVEIEAGDDVKDVVDWGPPPNPKQLHGDKKVQLQLVPPSAKVAIAIGLEEGAIKYGPWNWRDNPVELMTYYGALCRHMDAWVEGEDVDPDGSGKTHLDGAIASLAILIDASEGGTCIDNRPENSNGNTLRALQRGAREDVKHEKILG